MNWTVIICSTKLFGGLQVQVWLTSAEKIKKTPLILWLLYETFGHCLSPCLYSVKSGACIAPKAFSQNQTISLHSDEEQPLFWVEKLLHE